jgi:hypothetical protein
MPTEGRVAAGTAPCAACQRAAPCTLSIPNRSVAVRLSARIAIGASSCPRRQAGSHGAAQTRPQMLGNGLWRRACA